MINDSAQLIEFLSKCNNGSGEVRDQAKDEKSALGEMAATGTNWQQPFGEN